MTEEFKNVCNNASEQFNAIVKALNPHRKVDEHDVRRLLSFVDSIIDYYLNSEKQAIIRYPIIYIPCAKEWAEEVCVEYLIYKMETLYDINKVNELRNQLNQPWVVTGLTKRQRNQECERRNKVRNLIKTIDVNRNHTNTRNLIVCGQSLFGNIRTNISLPQFLEDNTTTSTTCSTVIDVEKKFADYKSFKNIFCFYSDNGICDTYEINSLNNWDGLHNCFIFEFSSAPYCLDNVLKWGKRLCDKFPHQYLLSKDDTQIKYQDFITLTTEEVHYIFGEEPQNAHAIIPYPDEIENERDFVADVYRGNNDWHFSIKDRNILSLCLCKEAQIAYMNYLKDEKPVLFDDSFGKATLENVLEYFPKNEIVDDIISFIHPDVKAAFIITDVPKPIKTAIIKFFKDKKITVKFYQYKNLKDKTIKEKKIVVMRFCPHNLSSKYYPHKNPNSFDEYSLKEGQAIIDIINELIILDYHRYKYEYDLRLFAVTNSKYRSDILGSKLEKPLKPNIQIISPYSELDDDANETPQNAIPTVRFEFLDGTTSLLPENEMIICENIYGKRFIESIRNLNNFGLLDKIQAIQPIYELADTTIDIFFEDERNTTTEMENKLRDELVNKGSIPQNHCHEVPIWKFLLERKIRDYSIVNQLIKSDQKEPLWQLLHQKLNDNHLQDLYKSLGVKVQLERVLRDWCDITKVEPIIPGIKKDRVNLIINYLEMNKGVLSLYRKKQLLTRNMTRTRNSVTEGFLSKILFDDITDELVAELLEDPQYSEYLTIDTKEDIETLKSIAEEKIILKPIKSYLL